MGERQNSHKLKKKSKLERESELEVNCQNTFRDFYFLCWFVLVLHMWLLLSFHVSIVCVSVCACFKENILGFGRELSWD